MVRSPFVLDILRDPNCQESWELHDAVEVGGADLEERGDVAAFDQDPRDPRDPRDPVFLGHGIDEVTNGL